MLVFLFLEIEVVHVFFGLEVFESGFVAAPDNPTDFLVIAFCSYPDFVIFSFGHHAIQLKVDFLGEVLDVGDDLALIGEVQIFDVMAL